ncbi:MAG: patatin-like phospholipase family protein [Gammaproteobacteria bacterium]
MRVGIALGSGGVKGLAHILMLEALDELGLRPVCVAGSSMGAIVGVLYCAGLHGRDLRNLVSEISLDEHSSWLDIIGKRGLLDWFKVIEPAFFGPGLLKAEGIIAKLFESIPVSTFEQLAVPLRVVAADFWERTEVVLEAGSLPPAVQASMSLPGIFAPVLIGQRVLIDGGAVNPVPFDRLPDDCDITIAVDVIGQRSMEPSRLPSLTDAVFNTFQIMQKSIIREKLRRAMPTIYVEPMIQDIRMLDFDKAHEVFKQAQPAKDDLLRQLEQRLKKA